jgi:uncharacterized protein (DUF2062 family)
MSGFGNFRYRLLGIGFPKLKRWLFSSSSPEKVCLSVVFGFYLGLFPVVGTTTVLGLLFTFFFRLNPLIVQAVNWSLYPAQLLLIYPFMKSGRILFFPDHELLPAVSLGDFWRAGAWGHWSYLGQSVAGGILVWLIFSLATGYWLYWGLLQLTRKKFSGVLDRNLKE